MTRTCEALEGRDFRAREHTEECTVACIVTWLRLSFQKVSATASTGQSFILQKRHHIHPINQ